MFFVQNVLTYSIYFSKNDHTLIIIQATVLVHLNDPYHLISGFEWKIFGLELSVSLKGEEYQAPYGSKWPVSLKTYSPPELKSNPSAPPTQNQDLWGLGCIIWEVFNGSLGQPADLGKLGKIPAKLAPVYKVTLL